MNQDTMQEKSYEESLAADISRMILSARESGLDLSQGFQNNAFSTSDLAVGYLFMSGDELRRVPVMPAEVKRKLKKANVLATIDVKGKKAGINLICALDMGFEAVNGEQEILEGLDEAGVSAYREHLTRLFKEDLVRAGKDEEK